MLSGGHKIIDFLNWQRYKSKQCSVRNVLMLKICCLKLVSESKKTLGTKNLIKIEYTCNYCGKPSNIPGALLFGPPREYNSVVKLHICPNCYDFILQQRVFKNRP